MISAIQRNIYISFCYYPNQNTVQSIIFDRCCLLFLKINALSPLSRVQYAKTFPSQSRSKAYTQKESFYFRIEAYPRFVPGTTGSVIVKMFSLLSKKCELVCVGVKILNFVYFGVNKSGISVFLVSAENGAGVNKNTNINYV